MLYKNIIIFLLFLSIPLVANLALDQTVSVSSEHSAAYPKVNAVDGIASDSSRWLSTAETDPWIIIELPTVCSLGGIHLYSGYLEGDPVEDLHVDFRSGGVWNTIPSANIIGNTSTALSIEFDGAVTAITDSLRVTITKSASDIARIREITIWPFSASGIPDLGTGVTGYIPPPNTETKPIYINQSGYNLNKPKRFTAPNVADNTPFQITYKNMSDVLFSGTTINSIGDFSDFNPDSDEEFRIISIQDRPLVDRTNYLSKCG